MILGKLKNWRERKEDSLKVVKNTTIAYLKEYGNTVLNIKNWKKVVRKVYKHKTGNTLRKYNYNYVTSKDSDIRDAVSVWLDYMHTILGFEITIREIDMDTEGKDFYQITSLCPCIVLERKWS
jgi:hypothetical protein